MAMGTWQHEKKLLTMAALISEAIGSILPGVECSTANSAPSWRRLPSPLAVTSLCHVWLLEALGGSHMLGRNKKKQTPPFQTSLSHREDGKPERRHFSWRQGGQGGLQGTCHPKSRTSFANPGREIGTVSILKSTARITTCFSRAFGMQRYPRLRCAVRQG